jgi:hypothetical protein
MKNKVLMSLILLTIASSVFAQAPTLGKLSFTLLDPNSEDMARYEVKAANNSISGAVVIPSNYQGSAARSRAVTDVANSGFQNITGITSVYFSVNTWGIGQNAFRGCTGLTDITIDYVGTLDIEENAFAGCTNLTSVTFLANGIWMKTNSFPGDLRAKYQAGGEGTYTRAKGSNTWTKQAVDDTPASTTETVRTIFNKIFDIFSGK